MSLENQMAIEIITHNKLNPLKAEIVQFLAFTDGATASDIFNHIKKAFKKKTRAEVYKRLNDLKSLSLVAKTTVKGKSGLNRPASIWYLTGHIKGVKKTPTQSLEQVQEERNFWQSEAERLGELIEGLRARWTEDAEHNGKNLKFQSDRLAAVSNYLNSRWYLGNRGKMALSELNDVINQLTIIGD